MSALKFVTEILSQNSRILITRPNLPIAEEVTKQLSAHSHISVISDDSQSFDYLIHFAGLDSPSLAETIFHTSSLHHFLDSASAHQAKFILVIPAIPSPLRTAAITLVTQFSKNFPLKFQIIEVDSELPISDSAGIIIKSFVHGHTSPHSPLVAPVQSIPISEVQPIRHYKISRFFLLPFLPYLVFLIQLPFLFLSNYCSLTSFTAHRFRPAFICAQIFRPLAQLTSFATQWLPGAKYVFIPTGLVPQTFSSFSQNYLETLTAINKISLTSPNQISVLIPATEESLAYFQLDLRQLYTKDAHPWKYIAIFAQEMNSLRIGLDHLQQISSDLPKFFPSSQKLTYLFLVQNTDKSFLATWDQGKFLDLKPYSASEIDSRLRGQITPPALFTQATGETQWFFRDITWDADFSVTAQKAAWFYDKSLGITPDVVVSIPEKMSTNFSKNPDNYLLLIESFENRQLFISPISFSSPALYATGWSGNLILPSCRSSLPCVSQYLYPLDTATIDIKKSQLIADISIQSIKFSYKIEYQGSSSKSKNFARVYLPPGVLIDTVKVGESLLPATSYSVSPDHGLILLAFPLEVPNSLTINYHLMLSNLSNQLHFQLDFQNQPNRPFMPLSFSINYPPTWFVTSYQAPDVASPGLLRYNSLVDRPLRFDVDFSFSK